MTSNTLKNTLLKSHKALENSDSAFTEQVAGDHYKTLKIQPIVFCMANKFNACQTHITKYITRYNLKWKDKKKQIEDLEKAKHVIDMLIEEIKK